MGRDIFMTGAVFAFAFDALLALGCVGQAPSEPRYIASSSEPEQMLVCTDPNDTQCMICDSTTHQCHFPVFKLP
jgi:hypothetical protein